MELLYLLTGLRELLDISAYDNRHDEIVLTSKKYVDYLIDEQQEIEL